MLQISEPFRDVQALVDYDPSSYLEPVSKADVKAYQEISTVCQAALRRQSLSLPLFEARNPIPHNVFPINLKSIVCLMRVKGKMAYYQSALFAIAMVKQQVSKCGLHKITYAPYEIELRGMLVRKNQGYVTVSYYNRPNWGKTPKEIRENLENSFSITAISSWDGKHRLGSALMYFAIAEALNMQKSSVMLYSNCSSGTFFFKFGFVSKEHQDKVEQAYHEGRLTAGEDMCLTEDAKTIWMCLIGKNYIVKEKDFKKFK